MNEVKCPKCGSTQISANKKGFNTGRAIAGGLITGNIWVAAASGGIGMNELRLTCLSCGHVWKIGRNQQTEKERTEYERRNPRTDIPQTAMYKCSCGWQGTQQYGHAFCERCNKQLSDDDIVYDFHAFEKKQKNSGCAAVFLLFPLLSAITYLIIYHFVCV